MNSCNSLWMDCRREGGFSTVAMNWGLRQVETDQTGGCETDLETSETALDTHTYTHMHVPVRSLQLATRTWQIDSPDGSSTISQYHVKLLTVLRSNVCLQLLIIVQVSQWGFQCQCHWQTGNYVHRLWPLYQVPTPSAQLPRHNHKCNVM